MENVFRISDRFKIAGIDTVYTVKNYVHSNVRIGDTAYTAGQLKLNQNARLYITESIREDAFDLFGFISREEQRCFELLTSVNGVGPKAALAILSSGGPQNFTLAVMTGDEKMLTAAQGVGKKLAQRIILELKEKIGGSSMELDFSAFLQLLPFAALVHFRAFTNAL